MDKRQSDRASRFVRFFFNSECLKHAFLRYSALHFDSSFVKVTVSCNKPACLLILLSFFFFSGVCHGKYKKKPRLILASISTFRVWLILGEKKHLVCSHNAIEVKDECFTVCVDRILTCIPK